jgi:UDP-2-acetamido-3-amino-2,3-dideoxy-glucuronate N-acetyltransferase
VRGTSAKTYVHPTADVAADAKIGAGTRVWNQAQVREGAVIGSECIVGKGAYIDQRVRIGDRCKIQNGVSVFHGFEIEDGVFLGPGVMLLNDDLPRAITPDGSLKSDADWVVSEGRICKGASIGGGAVVLPGVVVGEFAMIGAGAVVTKAVPPHRLAYGNPARLHGYVCRCGKRLKDVAGAFAPCPSCGFQLQVVD